MTDFRAFFKALWASPEWPEPEPFPWQTMLAEHAAKGDWPKVISLPTASGKTACLDAALFGLAAGAALGNAERLPRRIWFVVDRRIVVDEAFERARKIASRLRNADSAPLGEVTRALCSLSGTERPLAVARLRGGTWISKGWARRPSQPTIICSTVDQVGSALLFRAYGHSDETASIYAGLAAHDSLIILDEAHCAGPFMQTLEAVARYREEPWSERPLRTPFCWCVMSATLPDGVSEAAMFPLASERAAALDDPLLHKRITARKLATLEKPVKGDDEVFAAKAAESALRFRNAGKVRIAVMVNRVAAAKRIADLLRNRCDGAADVVLLTGRMRPLDRDALVERWTRLLKAGSKESPKLPVIVVTTQCLEVGADFSFDALVTECASLDSLQQRFGRLDRFGDSGESEAVILIRERDAKQPRDNGDPIYGKAIHETWTWLNEPDDSTVDFGIAAMGERVDALRTADPQRFRRLLAPWDDAPVLLPAHLDMLCQTSPRPSPEPDAGLFLHGKGRSIPEVRVVFRADLRGDDTDVDTLSLVPPTSPEILSVPLHRLRLSLQNQGAEDTDGDVEGLGEDEDEDEEQSKSIRDAVRKFVIWRGRERSEVTKDLRRVRPNDVLALRLSRDRIFELGQAVDGPEGLGAVRLDLAEQASRKARGRALLRVNRDVLEPLLAYASVRDLLSLAETDPEREEVQAALDAVLAEDGAVSEASASGGFLGGRLREAITDLLADDRLRLEDHPAGGLILIGKKKREGENDLFADADDLTSEDSKEVSWQTHTGTVSGVADEFAALCVDRAFHDVMIAAAQAHDLGKLDWRFQLLLRDGDWTALSVGEPLAKSAEIPKRKRRRREIEEDARLPKGFRHEFLSMQLAESFELLPRDEESRELALHLVASHHGYARPFAPPVPDKLVAEGRAGDLCLKSIGIDSSLSAAERRDLAPADRVDSGVADRFWRLTRRYGWWGLAYLESVFRLSDWEASRRHRERPRPDWTPRKSQPERVASGHRVPLDALDGANPLAFLAALGAVRILTRVLPGYRPHLSWEQRLGAWRPLLWTDRPIDGARICEVLCTNGLNLAAMFSEELLAATVTVSPKNKKGEAAWKDKLKFPVTSFRDFCRAASESRSLSADFAGAFAGETAPTVDNGRELALRTRFDFTAGQQTFIGMVRELKETCTVGDLQHSLFTGWRYSTASVSMRWDTQDEKRQYALQSSDPTKSANPPMADRGANFLAVEGLALFPVVPNRGADQAGFEGKGDGRSWTWPIWTRPIGLDAVRSLLTLPLSDSQEWPSTNRQQIAVLAVFQSRIVMPSGRYRCFTPARSV